MVEICSKKSSNSHFQQRDVQSQGIAYLEGNVVMHRDL
jgi:hypothetical protein